jgi:ATP-binding cassette subfamily B protein
MEMIGIGLIVPFLSILSGDNFSSKNAVVSFFYDLVQSKALIIILFGSTAFVSGLFRLFQLNWNTQVSFKLGVILNRIVYKKILEIPYSDHISKNTSEVIDTLTKKTDAVIYGVILQVINLASSLIMVIFVLAIVFLIDPILSLSTFSIVAIIYLIIIYVNKIKLKVLSGSTVFNSIKIHKELNECMGVYRDVVLDGSQSFFIKKFEGYDKKLRESQAKITFLTTYPRYVIESTAMVALAGIVYFYSKTNNDLSSLTPLLGVVAISANRLLPLVQQIYSCWANILASQSALQEILDICARPDKNHHFDCAIRFDRAIEVKDLSLTYPGNRLFKSISLKIKKGQFVAFVGESGAGKSTLMDILMGLIEADSGYVYVDDVKIESRNIRSYQNKISHVPQDIYLTDGSLIENIILSSDAHNIDLGWLNKVIEMSGLDELVRTLPDGVYTKIGQNGSLISGGQKQRIGIARALYKKSEIIFLDEATSALDKITEGKIINEIIGIRGICTIILITHNLYNARLCDSIYKINNGNLKKVFYEDIRI